MAGYEARFDELTSLGLGLAAISVDAPERSRALVEQLGLSFTLLCDPARQVVEAYGLLNRKEKGGTWFPITSVPMRMATVTPIRTRSSPPSSKAC